jgi:mannose-6-phosphate isomerase-like protein (cupin superfamily)
MRRIDKPWGHEIVWAQTSRYVGKILHINQGEALSLQYHERKEETIYLQTGRMRLVLEDGAGRREVILQPGEVFHIPPRMRHRFIAEETCDVFEVSTPELDDVVRLEDRYGREVKSR